jgi:hypothetical protein
MAAATSDFNHGNGSHQADIICTGVLDIEMLYLLRSILVV